MLKVMADNGIDISAREDGALYNVAMNNQDFIIKGLGAEFNMYDEEGLEVVVETGEAIIHGRHVTYRDEEPMRVSLPSNSSGYICIKVDLSNPQGQEAVLHVSPSLSLTKEEINWDGFVYEMPLYSFSTSRSEVTSLTKVAIVKDSASGNPDDLQTKSKDIVGAINEVKGLFDAMSENLIEPRSESSYTHSVDFKRNIREFKFIIVVANNEPIICTTANNGISFSGNSCVFIDGKPHYYKINIYGIYDNGLHTDNFSTIDWLSLSVNAGMTLDGVYGII